MYYINIIKIYTMLYCNPDILLTDLEQMTQNFDAVQRCIDAIQD